MENLWTVGIICIGWNKRFLGIKMKKLGIIGGMSPESTVVYYQEINRLVNKARGGNHSAHLILASVNFQEIVHYQKNNQWDKAGLALSRCAQQLEQAGADALILATNTMHKVANSIIEAVNIPFIHIIDVMAEALLRQKISQVGLLGTIFTMQDDFYRQRLAQHGIEMFVPHEQSHRVLNEIIFTELCVGKWTAEAKNIYLNAIAELDKQGAEAIILGCTEIGLLIQQDDSPLALFDSTQIHIEEAVHFILNE